MQELFDEAFLDFKAESLFRVKSDVLQERYSLYVKKDFPTACWTYSPPHRIFVGDKSVSRIKKGSTRQDHIDYIKSYLWHEYAHALYTERDFNRTSLELKRIRAPFSVYNRFEDIRIEHLARDRWEDFRFDWTRFENLERVEGSTARDADNMLFLLTQLEGNEAAVRKYVADTALLEQVLPFYREACQKKTSLALMNLIDRWLRKFPDLRDVSQQGKPGMADMPLSIALSLDEAMLEEFMQDAQNAEDRGDGTSEDEKATGSKMEDVREAGDGSLLGRNPQAVDESQVSEVVDLLSAIYSKRSVKVSTSSPSRRVSIRHHIIGRGPYRQNMDSSRKPKRLTVVVDCSGSMSGKHIAAARVLVLALSRLAQVGAVQGSVVLSKISRVAMWERFQLPMSEESVSLITADGQGEGLSHALRCNRQQAVESDVLLVLTDGDITDEPLNKSWLHALGVFTVGVYVGSDKTAPVALKQYFDHVIVRPTVSQLVEDLLLNL